MQTEKSSEEILGYQVTTMGVKGSVEKVLSWINLGERQNMNKGALVKLVCTETGISSNQMGRIDVLSGKSFFEIDDQVASKILPKIETGVYEGKTFSIELSHDSESQRYKGNKRRR